ncbi:xanthine dehydrogenase family protein molybdopterin-binding subunit [Halorarius litoreus]|uniref:xanthine dehydrogenase family protein molybdopterin-binding subunit n=1 Tax=Halorarius litoreus TaxID=2962676 RepID=UPI0020CBC40D|nr:xanthine dehydrogenase family protein molybdopterin-binding subunit [Halorarius litoreus]
MSSENAPGSETMKSETGTLVGAEVDRREDPALLTGDAQFTDDITAPHMTHAAMARSRYAHADILDIDTSAAEAMDGVIAVITQADIDASDAKGTMAEMNIAPGIELPEVERPLMARDRVYYAGEALATVIAEDRYTAHQAADRVEVEYDRLDAVVDPFESLEDDSVTIHDEAPDNTAYYWGFGDEDAMDEIFEAADNTVELEMVNQRLVANSMEPRAALAQYKASENKLRVDFTSQMPHNHRTVFTDTLNMPEHKIHLNAPDVGGGFGMKAAAYPDELITAWAAKELKRPVKWVSTRTEAYQTDTPGRGHHIDCSMAVDDDGSVQGLRVDSKVDLGGYVSSFASAGPTGYFAPMLSMNYKIPAIEAWVTGVFTNKTPVDAYRGAGRPEACYVVERLMDKAAREIGMDRTEIRRKNFIKEDEFPYEVATGLVYDSGNYDDNLDKALDIVDYESFKERQEAAREEGRYLGIGIGCFVENAGPAPAEASVTTGTMGTFTASGQIRVNPGGTITAYAGTADHGQGNMTSFTQIISDELGVPFDSIEIMDGDTEYTPDGSGTMGSHSAPVGGSAIKKSAEKVVDKARKIVAHQLEAAEEDIVQEEGEFHVAGAPDRSMTFQEVAHEAHQGHQLPDDMEPGLEASAFYDPVNFTFAFGTHIAIVEVDPDTGEVDFERYVAVDDCGVQINPKLVAGQVMGGAAQGIGQALYEGEQYNENGTLETASMQDYAVPRANHIPEMELDETVTPSPHNPMGVKGVAESATIGSTPAVVNAVLDALEPWGIDHLEMPLDNETVWSAINEADGN